MDTWAPPLRLWRSKSGVFIDPAVKKKAPKRPRGYLGLMVCVVACGIPLSHSIWTTAHAQPPTVITSSGLNTQIGPPTKLPNGLINYDITGGTRPDNGPNLFHSFGQFSVAANNIANFLNETLLPTTNILGRVTGGQASSIFGTLQTTGFGNANLFLINPSGIVFGPTASLNVGGSVHFSTADYLRFTDGMRFTALPGPQDALLSTAPVAAFGFLAPNPAAIAIQGSTLVVPTGQTLSFIGGDTPFAGPTGAMIPGGVTVTGGTLSAPSGRINLTSVGPPTNPAVGGEVVLSVSGELNTPSGFSGLGTITVNQDARLDASGNSQGNIVLRGGQVTIADAATIMTANASARSGAVTMNGTGVGINGTDVRLDAPEVAISGARIDVSGTGGGKISIKAGQFVMEGGSLRADNINGAPTAIDVQVKGDVILGQGGQISTTTAGTAPGGAVQVVAENLTVKEAGTIFTRATATGTGGAGSISVDVTNLNVAGTSSSIRSLTFRDGRGGDVRVKAKESVLLTDGGKLETSSFPGAGKGPVGDVTVVASNVTLQGGLIDSFTEDTGPAGNVTVYATGTMSLSSQSPSGLSRVTSLSRSGSGSTGNISLNVGRLELKDQASIDIASVSNSKVQRHTGELSVHAADTVMLTGKGQLANFGSGSSGSNVDVGNIEIQAPHLIMDGGRVSTSNQGQGRPGNITVEVQSLSMARDSHIDSGPSNLGAGLGGLVRVTAGDSIVIAGHSGVSSLTPDPRNAGEVVIATRTLALTDGSTISTATTAGGNAGTVLVSAANVILQGGARIDSSTSGAGTGGDIQINAGKVALSDGATISAKTSGAGNAGVIAITAGDAFLSNHSTVTTTTTQARGGDITIRAGQSVTLDNGVSISASSTGPGNAGNITIHAGNQFLSTNSAVTTQASQASGGNISITASDMVRLTNSQITASVFGGPTTVGGNISIDPNFVILQNSQILARAVQGNGGNIAITTNVYLPDANSIVDASSEFGVNGTVTIQSPTSQLSGHIVPLPQSVLQASSLLRQRCAAQMNGQSSSFVLAGRESLPAEPGGWLSSPLAALPAGEGLSAGAGLGAQSKGLAGEKQIVSLRRLTPAGFLTQAFADDGSVGCGS